MGVLLCACKHARALVLSYSAAACAREERMQPQCVCFLPIRRPMTGHVVKQLAGLFMDQQLWEEI